MAASIEKRQYAAVRTVPCEEGHRRSYLLLRRSLGMTGVRNVCVTVRLVSKSDLWWPSMLDEGERDATAEEIAHLEEAYGPFLPSDGEG
jgi:hypothetical protein